MMLQNASINALSLLRGDIYRSKKKGIFFRKKVIDILSRTGWIKTNFIVRNEYFAGELNTKLSSSFGSVREEYVNNLLNSDYALCVKGDGNYSIRFSEALCAGRIPLLIDTACVLPFDDLIKYKSFLPIVDFQDIETTSERLRDFHEKLSSEEFVELQNKARQLWEAHLSPHGMFKTICNILEKRVHKI